MNSKPKLDLHPDAESLNAFAEQALPARERGQILAHLAECNRCRQVVYLAQESVDAMEAEPELDLAVAAAAPRLDSTARRKPRFRRWRFAWVPVGALAVIVSTAYVVHLRHVEIAAEQAKAARDAAAHNVEMAVKMPVPPMVAAAPALASQTAKKPKPEIQMAASQQVTVAAAPPLSDELSATLNASSEEVAQHGANAAQYHGTSAAVEFKPDLALAERQQAQARAAGAIQARSMAAEKQPGTKAGAGAGESAQWAQTGGMLTAAAAPAQSQANSPIAGSAETSARLKAGRTFALYKAKAAALPSGLPPISTETMQSYTLAVDGAGGVFLSLNTGSHWESVAKQWSGRAVAVRLQMAADKTEGAKSSPGGALELVNDHGLVWVSTDGRIWKAK